MKKIFLIIIIFSCSLSLKSFAQGNGDENRHRLPLERIEQLEKAKLIEILDLKEDAAVRFFVRRNEFRNEQRNLFVQRDALVKKIEKKFKDDVGLSDKEYKDQLNEILSLDLKIVKDKENFLNSLDDILTPSQILKLAVFDNRLMREIKDLLMDRRKGRKG